MFGQFVVVWEIFTVFRQMMIVLPGCADAELEDGGAAPAGRGQEGVCPRLRGPGGELQLYCTVLYCTVLHSVLYCTVLQVAAWLETEQQQPNIVITDFVSDSVVTRIIAKNYDGTNGTLQNLQDKGL